MEIGPKGGRRGKVRGERAREKLAVGKLWGLGGVETIAVGGHTGGFDGVVRDGEKRWCCENF